MRVSQRRYTHSSPPSVYNHMLIPINLLLVGKGREGKGRGGGSPQRVLLGPARPLRGGLEHSHVQL